MWEAYRARLEETFARDVQKFPQLVEEDEESEIPAWALPMVEACGEDCDECVIPEEMRGLYDNSELDVFGFLGIKRAEPLRVNSLRDWE
jgi:hypothetical protein